MHRQPGQVGQRAPAAAEVVQREPDAEVAQLVQHPVDHREVADHRRLGDLQGEPAGGHPVPGQRGGHLAGEVAVEQGPRRDVDGDRDADAVPGPVRGAAQRDVQHPAGQVRQQAGVLDHRQELLRPELAAGRVVPADQRLGGDRLAGVQVEDRLVDQVELAHVVQRGAQLARQHQPADAADVALRRVEGDPADRAGSRVQGDAGLPEQLVERRRRRAARTRSRRRRRGSARSRRSARGWPPRRAARPPGARPGPGRSASAAARTKSSPSSRATSSPGITAAASRRAVCRSTASPAA